MAKAKEAKDEFVQWFQSLRERRDRLKIFERKRGEFFTVYGKRDSEIIADAFFRSRKAISDYGDKVKIECIHLKPKLYETVVKDFVVRRKSSVELYCRSEENGQWVIREVITGSNLSAGSMGEAAFNLSSIIMTFSNQNKRLGIALYNHSNSAFEIAEYIEDNQYTKLTSVLVAKGVQRCIFHCQSRGQHADEIKKLEKLMMRHGVQMVDVESEDDGFWKFIKNEASTMRSVQNIINKESCKRLQTLTQHTKALAALNGIIKHEELLKDDVNFYRFTLREHRIDSFMRLDSSALEALNLFPSGNQAVTSSNKKHSLYGVLKQCRSPMGNRLLSTWIRQPLVDIAQLHRRQKLVKLFVENTEQREILREEHFKALIDFEKMVQKLQRNKADLKNLVELYNFVEKLPWIKDTLQCLHDVEFTECEEDEDEDDDIKIERETPLKLLKSDFVTPIEGMMRNFNHYIAMIEQVVDLAQVQNRKYLISKNFDKILEQLDRKMGKLQQQMERCRDAAGCDLEDPKKVTLVDNKRLGWCLRIPAKAAGMKKLRKKAKVVKNKKGSSKPEYDILLSLTGGAFFLPIGSPLADLGREHKRYQKRFNERQNMIIGKTLEIAQTYIPVIQSVISVFSELDVILSLSSVADNAQTAYVLPTVLPRSGSQRVLKMTNARHPCLELIQMDEAGDVIPNHVDMVRGHSSFQVVTGPNMGGKSTYIRMVGLITLMAQIGSYVPCDECTVTMVDSILARVGAGDNQMKGVSTFMAEMLEAASILEGATEHSLVIIDELGRGTSTYDGYGLAFAISEHIAEKLQSFCLFATHFHELSMLEKKHKAVVNKHVDVFLDADQDSLVMLYKMKSGPCPQSYGIQVAKLAKFPENVIKTAQEKARMLESVEGSVEPAARRGSGVPKLSANALASMQKVVAFARTHGDDADYKDKLQSLIEAECEDAVFNDLCNEVMGEVNSSAGDKMEVDA